MADNDKPLLLGSASPRRASLLDDLGVSYEIAASTIDEEAHHGVAAIAGAKFRDLTARHPRRALLTADTLVLIGDIALGKPADRIDAVDMVRRVSGRSITVDTAVCFGTDLDTMTTVRTRSTVAIKPLADAAIQRYVASGEADDKAGALALQGGAGAFIESVAGCWSNVVGLPTCVVGELLGMTPPPVVCRCARPETN